MAASHDLDLVRAALAGDRRAFDRLFDACFGMAARFVEARADSPGESQERIRHALRALFARLPDYRGETPLFVFAFVAMTWSLAPPQRGARAQESAPPRTARAGERRRVS